jgi:hypothetical protein
MKSTALHCITLHCDAMRYDAMRCNNKSWIERGNEIGSLREELLGRLRTEVGARVPLCCPCVCGFSPPRLSRVCDPLLEGLWFLDWRRDGDRCCDGPGYLSDRGLA